jgi:hypothetical protein
MRSGLAPNTAKTFDRKERPTGAPDFSEKRENRGAPFLAFFARGGCLHRLHCLPSYPHLHEVAIIDAN